MNDILFIYFRLFNFYCRLVSTTKGIMIISVGVGHALPECFPPDAQMLLHFDIWHLTREAFISIACLVHDYLRILWFQLLHLPQNTRNWCKRPVLIFLTVNRAVILKLIDFTNDQYSVEMLPICDASNARRHLWLEFQYVEYVQESIFCYFW